MKANFSEFLKVAFRNIRGNLLRSILTCIIIALGITALVGIQTVIAGLGNSVADMFSSFGTNQFTISNRAAQFDSSDERKPNPVITYDEAALFKETFKFPSKISLSISRGGGIEVKGNGEKTNPNYSMTGGDENYLELNSYEVLHGRDFSINEYSSGENVVIIPMNLKTTLFKDFKDEDVIGKRITVSNQRYRIVGLLKDKGQGFGGTSNFVFVPIENFNIHYATPRSNYGIKIGVSTSDAMEPAMAEAAGIMRMARRLRTIDENNFNVNNPGAATKELAKLTKNVSLGGLLIGLITLFGAAIGLMNILLVSVTERIKEIGLSKALGATVQSIRLQYFLEGMLISILGGILGIVMGLLIGLLVSKVLKSAFVVPWGWIASGMFICLVVGLVSSIYPAIKASRLNPIEALRQN